MKILQKSGGILDFIVSHFIKMEGNKSTGQEAVKKKAKHTVENAESLSFQYLDIGCNEGDLTMQMAKAIAWRLSTKCQIKDTTGMVTLHANGIDIDEELIHAATRKHLSTTTSKTTSISSCFTIANVLFDNLKDKLNCPHQFHLTSIFSTTMWIHIHGGDKGLEKALGRACQCTKWFVLIEPQPSKCYRSAANRLRKMGLVEIDVSSKRLKVRLKLEEAIDSIMLDHCFQRVSDFDIAAATTTTGSSSHHSRCDDEQQQQRTNNEENATDTDATVNAKTTTTENGEPPKASAALGTDKTKWNRPLWLYRRVREVA